MLESDDEFSFLLPGVGIERAGCLGHRSMTSPRGCGGVRQGVKYGSVRMRSLTGRSSAVQIPLLRNKDRRGKERSFVV